MFACVWANDIYTHIQICMYISIYIYIQISNIDLSFWNRMKHANIQLVHHSDFATQNLIDLFSKFDKLEVHSKTQQPMKPPASHRDTEILLQGHMLQLQLLPCRRLKGHGSSLHRRQLQEISRQKHLNSAKGLIHLLHRTDLKFSG